MSEQQSWKVEIANISNLQTKLEALSEAGYQPRWVLADRSQPGLYVVISQPTMELEMMTGEMIGIGPVIDDMALRGIIEAAFDAGRGGAPEALAEIVFTRILAAHGAGNLLKK